MNGCYTIDHLINVKNVRKIKYFAHPLQMVQLTIKTSSLNADWRLAMFNSLKLFFNAYISRIL